MVTRRKLSLFPRRSRCGGPSSSVDGCGRANPLNTVIWSALSEQLSGGKNTSSLSAPGTDNPRPHVPCANFICYRKFDLTDVDRRIKRPVTQRRQNPTDCFTNRSVVRFSEHNRLIASECAGQSEGDNCESRSDRRQWSHRIKARQQASRAWARSRGRVAQKRRRQHHGRRTCRCAERRFGGRRRNELPFLGGHGRAEVFRNIDP